ncbi:hypothetical protein DRN43_07250 [Thermococci archaeon]|uniref:hypothetical protein n=1 Tax=Palaeococcus sp. (in: euryarchaeotes) TaxID=2820298 RepID=UPI000F0DBE38|nr:hypothetical protein [Palaeococcus sp. (in: euryarchaeotes)]MCD6558297.1 hypothetical protein [Palaeococcus sp. (in: euryarchaeotes)]RLF78174.1 MAG: hypothetical protein DRN39_01955 [Thermococci archaeon]RLF87608.1 MAG: hypothetical protein DRN43_07250 [Thermococci archaeon]
MKAYVTMLGRSTWAMINAYYAIVMHKKYYPDEIYIFLEDIYAEKIPKAVGALKIISRAFGFEPKINWFIVEEANFVDADKKIGKLLKELKEKGFEIAIEITSGRKAVVAGALIHGIPLNVDHVFYLAIRSMEYANRPYMMIPLHVQILRDFVGDRE